MEKTLKIEGMMCGHCEARVQKCLEALSEVESANVSHESGTAVVTLNAEIADSTLQKAVEDQDYKVLSIQQLVQAICCNSGILGGCAGIPPFY